MSRQRVPSNKSQPKTCRTLPSTATSSQADRPIGFGRSGCGGRIEHSKAFSKNCPRYLLDIVFDSPAHTDLVASTPRRDRELILGGGRTVGFQPLHRLSKVISQTCEKEPSSRSASSASFMVNSTCARCLPGSAPRPSRALGQHACRGVPNLSRYGLWMIPMGRKDTAESVEEPNRCVR